MTGSGGWFGFAKWGKIGWLPSAAGRLIRATHGQVLAEGFVRPARAPGYRCPSCRVVWFEY